ncbi:DUF4399 domain-containing protein [Thiolapillus sp.]
MNRPANLVAAMAFLTTGIAQAHSPGEDARVYFRNLKDGDVISSPFTVEFGIRGYGIVPAGTRDKRRHTAGHHHLLVDYAGIPPLDEPIPYNRNCIHFDAGETRAELQLPPGTHTLQLLLGDETHEPTEPPLLSPRITVTVKP